jgi:aminopeptidase-like protein
LIGESIHEFAKELWPLNRSITGEGVRQTLEFVRKHIPELRVNEVKTGTKAFDWVVPREWLVKDAWIKTPDGKKICDFKKNNLHILGYSLPVHGFFSLEELQKNLYSLPEQPNAIPYVTSYYEERWGFCIRDDQRSCLEDGEYEVFIDAEHFDGILSYGELILKGRSSKEIFLSTYICHPSMGNNEISGISVLTFLAKYFSEMKDREYTYRIVFVPETIGSIVYLSKNLKDMKEKVYAGFNITCVGDDRAYSYLPSRKGNTISDNISKHVLKFIDEDFRTFGWNDRGSDERQYCAPLIDLPVASIMRTKYGEYPEYHTSLDDLNNVVTPSGLYGGYVSILRAVEAIEKNNFPLVRIYGEPQMGRRGLYSTLGKNKHTENQKLLMNVISYSDGQTSLLEIADLCAVPIWKLYPIIDTLTKHEIISIHKMKYQVNDER